jgi:hypothetical protein
MELAGLRWNRLAAASGVAGCSVTAAIGAFAEVCGLAAHPADSNVPRLAAANKAEPIV